MKEIKGGCTPRITLLVDFDPNPNGEPVVWLCINNTASGKRIGNGALDKNAVNELIIELQKRVSEM